MVPTSTGAAKAIFLVLPELKGKLQGLALRVPTPTVSIVDLVVEIAREATAEDINNAFKAASQGQLKGILGYCEEPLVSLDFKGNPLSSIVDAPNTMVAAGNMVKVLCGTITNGVIAAGWATRRLQPKRIDLSDYK